MSRKIAAIVAALLCSACGAGSAAGTTSEVGVSAPNSWSVRLAIMPADGATHVEVLRDGRPIDAFPVNFRQPVSYTDYLLWPSTSFTYEIRALDGNGQLIDTRRLSVITPAQQGPIPPLYAATSFWNQPIPANPAVDPGSDAMVAKAMVPYRGAANFWAGSNSWAKPLAYANSVSPLYKVGCTKYDCDSTVSFRIPLYAAPSTGSDHHLVVIDSETGKELDMWLAAHEQATDSWTAAARYVTDPNGWGAICGQKQHCGAAVAAGFAAFGGIVRPEEIAQGHIDHALFFTTPYTRKDYIACPATHTDGQHLEPAAIPQGARIQLDPTFDVDAQPWPRWEKVLARALQKYGAYLGDTGDSLSFAAEATLDRGYDAWSMVGVPAFASLGNLPWSKFRILALHRC